MGFFLVFGAWSFAAPYDGPADEAQHVIRAVGVVSGQIAPAPAVVKDYRGFDGMGAYQQVPGGLLDSRGTCWGYKPSTSAACAAPLHGGPVRSVPTTAGRYQPLYYALVGLPLKLSPNWTGLLIARLISSALSAALLAFAFVVLARWSRYGLMMAGLIAVSTPMLAHMAGAVNPNGLEIASGISLFAAGIPLLLGPRRGPTAPLIWLLGVSAALLATLRSLGPLWLVFGLAALLLPQSRAVLRRLWSRRLVRVWSIIAVVATVLSVGWDVVMKAGAVIPTRHFSYSVSGAALEYLNRWGGEYLDGMVGVAGWFDVFMPAPLYIMWIATAGALILFALVVGSWVDRWRFVVLFAGGVVVPGLLQVAEVNRTGFITAGRYMLPLLVGMPLLAAFILERKLLNARRSHSFVKLSIIMMFPAQLALLVFAMGRWQKGRSSQPHTNPFTGSWHPPTTSYPPLILMVAGLALLAWVFWTTPRWLTNTPDLAEDEAAGDGTAGGGPDQAELPGGDLSAPAEAGGDDTQRKLDELLAHATDNGPAQAPAVNGGTRATGNGATVNGLAEPSPR